LESAHVFGGAVVTRIEPLKGFYAAEDYHQDYLVHNPRAAYIVYNDLPKIDALKRVWPQYFQEKPVLMARN
jgi:peptide-methionine (S)-S-oxide reductase